MMDPQEGQGRAANLAGMAALPRRPERARALRLARKGVTNSEIARRLNVPEASVRFWRKAAGLPPSRGRPTRRTTTPRRERTRLTVYLDGPDLAALTDRARRERLTVSAFIRRVLRRELGLPT